MSESYDEMVREWTRPAPTLGACAMCQLLGCPCPSPSICNKEVTVSEDKKAALGDRDAIGAFERELLAAKAADPSRAVTCELCGGPGYAADKRCDRCWDLERRILLDAPLARRILDKIDATQLSVAIDSIRADTVALAASRSSMLDIAIAALRDIADQPPTFGTDCRSGDQKMWVAQAALEKMGIPELEAIYDAENNVVGWK